MFCVMQHSTSVQSLLLFAMQCSGRPFLRLPSSGVHDIAAFEGRWLGRRSITSPNSWPPSDCLQRLWFDVYCRRCAPYKWLCMYVCICRLRSLSCGIFALLQYLPIFFSQFSAGLLRLLCGPDMWRVRSCAGIANGKHSTSVQSLLLFAMQCSVEIYHRWPQWAALGTFRVQCMGSLWSTVESHLRIDGQAARWWRTTKFSSVQFSSVRQD